MGRILLLPLSGKTCFSLVPVSPFGLSTGFLQVLLEIMGKSMDAEKKYFLKRMHEKKSLHLP